MNKRKTYLLAILTAGLLAACGGSGNDGPLDPPVSPAPPAPPTGAVPPSAWASITAYFTYVGSLVLSDRDTPLEVNAVVPPTSETALPLPVN
jgi:hypothetical protein